MSWQAWMFGVPSLVGLALLFVIHEAPTVIWGPAIVCTEADVSLERAMVSFLDGAWFAETADGALVLLVEDDRGTLGYADATGALHVASVRFRGASLSGLVGFEVEGGGAGWACGRAKIDPHAQVLSLERVEPQTPWPECPVAFGRTQPDRRACRLLLEAVEEERDLLKSRHD